MIEPRDGCRVVAQATGLWDCRWRAWTDKETRGGNEREMHVLAVMVERGE